MSPVIALIVCPAKCVSLFSRGYCECPQVDDEGEESEESANQSAVEPSLPRVSDDEEDAVSEVVVSH